MQDFLEYLNLLLIFLGLVAFSLELFLGLDTQLDLSITGISLLIGGFVGYLIENNIVWGILVTVVLILLYFILFRSKLQDKLVTSKILTNSDKLVGQKGKIVKVLDNDLYLADIGGEKWSVRCNSKLQIGDEVEVLDAEGSILNVIG